MNDPNSPEPTALTPATKRAPSLCRAYSSAMHVTMSEESQHMNWALTQ